MLQFIQSCWSNYLGVAEVANVADVAEVADVDEAVEVADVDQAEQVVPVILLVTQESWLVTLAYTPGAFDWGVNFQFEHSTGEGESIFNF